MLLILGCFSVCWLPYFIVACAQIFQYTERSSPTVYKVAFTLALGNSGMNPLIYAWKNTGLRLAFVRLLRFRHPDCPGSYKPSTNRRRTRATALAAASDRRRSSMLAIDDVSFGDGGRAHELSKSADFGAEPSLVDSMWNGYGGGSLNDRRLVDILHIDIGVCTNKERSLSNVSSDVQRYSASIIPIRSLSSFKSSIVSNRETF